MSINSTGKDVILVAATLTVLAIGTASAQTPVTIPVPFTQCVTNEAGYVAEVRWFNVNDKARTQRSQKIAVGQTSCNTGLRPAQSPRFVRVTMLGTPTTHIIYEGVPEMIVIYGTFYHPKWKNQK